MHVVLLSGSPAARSRTEVLLDYVRAPSTTATWPRSLRLRPSRFRWCADPHWTFLRGLLAGCCVPHPGDAAPQVPRCPAPGDHFANRGCAPGDGPTVAARVKEYAELGIDTFICSGYPHLEESYRVAELLFPHLDVAAPTRPERRGYVSPFGEMISSDILPKAASAS